MFENNKLMQISKILEWFCENQVSVTGHLGLLLNYNFEMKKNKNIILLLNFSNLISDKKVNTKAVWPIQPI